MKTSTVTAKGQVTIPAAIRERLGIRPGDQVRFSCQDDNIIIRPVVQDIEAAFGLVNAERSASPDDLKQAIRQQGRQL